MFRTEIEYGWRQLGPPTAVRNGSAATGFWRDGVVEPFKRRGIDVKLCSKRELVERCFGPLIGQRPFAAAERLTVSIALGKVLADLRADFFQEEADVSHNWIIAEEAVLRLQKVMRAQEREHSGETEGKPIDSIVERKRQQQDRRSDRAGESHVAPREGQEQVTHGSDDLRGYD